MASRGEPKAHIPHAPEAAYSRPPRHCKPTTRCLIAGIPARKLRLGLETNAGQVKAAQLADISTLTVPTDSSRPKDQRQLLEVEIDKIGIVYELSTFQRLITRYNQRKTVAVRREPVLAKRSRHAPLAKLWSCASLVVSARVVLLNRSTALPLFGNLSCRFQGLHERS
jgi:hypothetical protein